MPGRLVWARSRNIARRLMTAGKAAGEIRQAQRSSLGAAAGGEQCDRRGALFGGDRT